MLMEVIVGDISKVHCPAPPPSKVAVSAATGTEAPPAPPELADQLAVLFQVAAEAEIQYRVAASAGCANAMNAPKRNNEIHKEFFPFTASSPASLGWEPVVFTLMCFFTWNPLSFLDFYTP